MQVDHQAYSDLYKDVFGVRPRDLDLTEAEYQQAMNSLSEMLEFQLKDEAEEKQFQAIVARENHRLRNMYVDGVIPSNC